MLEVGYHETWEGCSKENYSIIKFGVNGEGGNGARCKLW